MAITVNLFAKKDYVSRDGTVPVYLRLTIHRRVCPPFLLLQRVKPSDWDEATRTVKNSNPLAAKINLLFQRELIRGQEIILNHEIKGRPLTYESFYNDYCGFNAYDFYSLVDDYLHINKGSFSDSYIEKVRHVTNKLRGFRPALEIHDIDYDFLKAYQYYMVNTRKNGKNTIYSNFRIIRRILNEAIKKKLLRENPFALFKLEKVKTEREALTIRELAKYEELLFRSIPYYLHKTLCWFLLACYTGRRYQDLVHYHEWVFYEDHIRVVSNKKTRNRDEKKIILVYVNKKIRHVTGLIQEHNYKPLTNSKANKFLMELNGMVGIQKHITFHCARHTFSNVNKQLNADLALRRDLLGHDSINSTMIYDHVDPDQMKMAMLKWDEIPDALALVQANTPVHGIG